MKPSACSRNLLMILVVLCFECVLGKWHQRFSRQPSNITAWVGETVILPCEVEGRRGHVQWTRNQFGMGIDPSLPEWPRMTMVSNNGSCFCSLQIVNLRARDSGIYQCQAGATRDQPGIGSQNAWLTVLATPSDPEVLQGEEVTVTAGTETELTCISRGGEPPPQLAWSNYTESESGKAVIINAISNTTTFLAGKDTSVSSVVRFLPVLAHHNTSLTCRMISELLPGKSRHVTTRLHVRYKPEVTLTPEVAKVYEYGDAVFNCSARANPASNLLFAWMVNGQWVSGVNRQQLKLSSVGRQLNEAKITCQVSSQIGVASHTGRLQVLYAPQLTSDLKDVSAEMGQSVTLTCDVNGNPSPDIRWVKHDCETCRKIVGIGRNLMLNASRDSAGLYECRAVSPGFPIVTSRAHVWIRSVPRVTAHSPQTAALGQGGFIECRVHSTPLPASTNWYMYERRITRDDGHFRVVNIPSPGGITSRLMIDEVVQTDFGLYNCSFGNEYGWHSAIVVLESAGRSNGLVLGVSAVLGCTMLVAAFILWLVLRRRINKTAPAVDRNGRVETKVVGISLPVPKQDNIALSLTNSRSFSNTNSSTAAANNLHDITSTFRSDFTGTLNSDRSTYSTLNTNHNGADVLPSILQQRHLFYGSHSAMYANPDKKCPLTLSRLPPPPSYRSSIQLATHV